MDTDADRNLQEPSSRPQADARSPLPEAERNQAIEQVRWFSYIAVGIAIASGVLGLGLMGGGIYFLVRWLGR